MSSNEGGALDTTRANTIGAWIARGRLDERVLMCLHLRMMYDDAMEKKAMIPAALGEEMWEKAKPFIEEISGAMLRAIEGLEDGEHVNPKAYPNRYRYESLVAGKDRKFAMLPDEAALATAEIPWSPDPPAAVW